MPQIVYGRQASGRLNRDELYVNLGCFRKCAQVAGITGIRGEDVVAVGLRGTPQWRQWHRTGRCGRLARMADIVDAVAFLLRNPTVNGVSLNVDGGTLLG